MRPHIKVQILDENGEKFFGEGPCRLLRAVEQTGSLGFALTTRAAGGREGGGSRLTPQGKEWLQRYEAYRDACLAADRRLYLEFFPGERQTAPDPDR